MSDHIVSDADGPETAKAPAVVNLTVSPKPGPQEGESAKISVAKLVLEYAKALVWPVFIALILLIYQPPIAPILKSLADKLESASSVKIGSLSLEVQQKANDLGVPGLGLEIGQLSADSIEALLQVRGTGSMTLLSQDGGNNFGLPKGRELNALRDLEKKGLIGPSGDGESIEKFVAYVKSVAKFSTPRAHDVTEYDHFEVNDSTGKINEKFQHYGYELTPAGHKAVEAITKAVAAQLSKE